MALRGVAERVTLAVSGITMLAAWRPMGHRGVTTKQADEGSSMGPPADRL